MAVGSRNPRPPGTRLPYSPMYVVLVVVVTLALLVPRVTPVPLATQVETVLVVVSVPLGPHPLYQTLSDGLRACWGRDLLSGWWEGRPRPGCRVSRSESEKGILYGIEEGRRLGPLLPNPSSLRFRSSLTNKS